MIPVGDARGIEVRKTLGFWNRGERSHGLMTLYSTKEYQEDCLMAKRKFGWIDERGSARF
ncbi:MAG: hypothetical protein WBG54_09350 [Acidobacteriaceae bacterium]